MTPKAWKIALAASVALNVFGLAGGVAAWVAHEKEAARDARMAPSPGGQPSFTQIMNGLDPEVRERVRTSLRSAAKAAKPDFQQARELRQRAIALAASPSGEVGEIERLLAESRAAEIRGRERMERNVAPLFATLGPADRQTLSVILRRKNQRDAQTARPEAPATPTVPAPAEPPRS